MPVPKFMLYQTGDDVSSGQDTGAQNSQDALCHHCKQLIPNTMDNLLKHSKSCHGIVRPNAFHHKYVCLYCFYHTYYNDNMRKHIRKHTEVEGRRLSNQQQVYYYQQQDNPAGNSV
uniref:C2H2-type domain-containing protein n=1 Tax=Cacopsylla melanoneura TaxID=428564 RepID=A0A8D9DYN1_9HEMI